MDVRSRMKPGDFHLVVSHRAKTMSCFSHDGRKRWTIPALSHGVGGAETVTGGDTPLGTYLLGALTVTQESEPRRTWNAFGHYFIDLVELENQEAKYSRAGCGVHGGGSGCPDPLAPMQPLLPTHGCVRVHNAHMESHVLWAYKTARHVYLTVQA